AFDGRPLIHGSQVRIGTIPCCSSRRAVWTGKAGRSAQSSNHMTTAGRRPTVCSNEATAPRRRARGMNAPQYASPLGGEATFGETATGFGGWLDGDTALGATEGDGDAVCTEAFSEVDVSTTTSHVADVATVSATVSALIATGHDSRVTLFRLMIGKYP